MRKLPRLFPFSPVFISSLLLSGRFEEVTLVSGQFFLGAVTFLLVRSGWFVSAAS